MSRKIYRKIKGVDFSNDVWPNERKNYLQFWYINNSTGDICNVIADGSWSIGMDHVVACFHNKSDDMLDDDVFWNITDIAKLQRSLESAGFEYGGFIVEAYDDCFWNMLN